MKQYLDHLRVATQYESTNRGKDKYLQLPVGGTLRF